MKLSLSKKIENYLRRKECWVASGEIQRIAMENGYYSPQNTGRRLRELHEEGILEVEYREKNHAWYRFNQNHYPKKPKVEIKDGVAVIYA